MDTQPAHLHLSVEASKLLDKYCTKRTRGAFISDLIVAYDRQQKNGEGVIEALRKRAKEAQIEASRAQNALNTMIKLQNGG